MNIKTKFKMGDEVYGYRPPTQCMCGHKSRKKPEPVEFVVEKMAIYLDYFGEPDINYCDAVGLAGWFEESELKKVKVK